MEGKVDPSRVEISRHSMDWRSAECENNCVAWNLNTSSDAHYGEAVHHTCKESQNSWINISI